MGGDFSKQLDKVKANDRSITSLSFTDPVLTTAHFKEICKGLFQSAHVTKLKFADQNITPVKAKMIAEMLKVNTSIQEVAMIRCLLSDETPQLLSEGLASHPMLHKLTLHGSGSLSLDWNPVFTALQQLSEFQELILVSFAGISEAMSSLAALLQSPACPVTLSLAQCELTANAWRLLFQSLQDGNTSLVQ
jgi:hypothetical protein